MDYSLTDSYACGVLQAKILEWVANPPPGDLPNPGMELRSPALQEDSLLSEPPGKPVHYNVQNRLLVETCCVAQGAQLGAL